MADPQWISVGRIRGSHGVHGALKIEPYSTATDSVLCRVRRWRLVESVAASAGGADGMTTAAGAPSTPIRSTPIRAAGPAAGPASSRALRKPLPAPARPLALPLLVQCHRCRAQGDALVAELIWPEGTPAPGREQVMALKGVEIQVDRADFPSPGDDEFYHADLIGCEVIGQQDQGLGTVVAVDDHGAQQVLRLADGMLIPFVREIVLDVDLKTRQIRVDWAADWR